MPEEQAMRFWSYSAVGWALPTIICTMDEYQKFAKVAIFALPNIGIPSL